MEYYWPDSPDRNHIAKQRLVTRRSGHVSVLMADGRVLTAGGRSSTEGDWDYFKLSLSSTELFNLRTEHVQCGPNMTSTRYRAAAALLGNSVYICGGRNYSSRASAHTLNSCERFAQDKWTAVASMAEKRRGLAMVAIDGKLFAIGGENEGSGTVSSVERFDAESNRWQSVGSMETARSGHGAAVLNGRIYVCGGSGYNSNQEQTCEHYDPSNNQWEMHPASMNRNRKYFSLVAINGRLYALGGDKDPSKYSVESSDPSTNSWTSEEQLKVERNDASAVVL